MATWWEDQRVSAGPGVPGRVVVGSQWHVEHAPAAATLATITKTAPGVGKHLVVTYLCASLDTAAATANNRTVRLTETVTTVTLLRHGLAVPATTGSSDHFSISNLHIVIAEDNGVVWRFDQAGAANSFEIIAMGGYIVQV